MRHASLPSLSTTLAASGPETSAVLIGAEQSVAFAGLIHGTVLAGRREELLGKSVLIAATDQAVAALAIIDLDGVARRMVLFPPDLSFQHLPYVLRHAEVDAIVSDRAFAAALAASPESSPEPGLAPVISLLSCDNPVEPSTAPRQPSHATEWVLLTSGTTGRPKMVLHTLASLTGVVTPVADDASAARHGRAVWSTFYDIRRYGGLQIFLRALATQSSLVLSGPQEPTAGFLARAGAAGVTHISGTPSHWRRALMSSAANQIDPEYVRLSGEIADQAILNSLHAAYPHARIGHAFATTEAGVAFDVNDGLAGFPPDSIAAVAGVEMKVVDGTLRIRSSRTATRYLGDNVPMLKDPDGWVDTGDVLDLRDGRYFFSGRRDGTINVGGMKVHPEEVEAVINRHPEVQISLVRTRKNPITGALVVADVVLKTTPAQTHAGTPELKQNILRLCRETLASHKVPTAINFVDALEISDTGKLIRRHA
jgi:acyl-coenzyme A synthetase/AMP-(fatty) acid ligase